MKITKLKKTLGQITIDINNFEISEGKIHGIIGHNGCGKTSLCKLLLDLIPAEEGQIDWNGLKQTDITMTSQRPYLLKGTVYDNIIYPLKLRKITPDETFIKECLQRFGLLDKKDQYALSLSSGERQKLSLIRAFIFNPRFVIIDETFANLDFESVKTFEEFILENQKKVNSTFIIISHQLPQLQRLCDKLHFMEKGKIIESGDTKELLNNSSNQKVRDYLKSQILQ